MDTYQRKADSRSLCSRSKRNSVSTGLVSYLDRYRAFETKRVVFKTSKTDHEISYDGEVVAQETMDDPEQFKNFDMAAFFGRHSKEIRWPEILGCATALKQEYGFKKLGVIGFCYGGWAVFQLGAKGACPRGSLNLLTILTMK